MIYGNLEKFLIPASSEQELEETVQYLADCMTFLKPGDRVLVCFAKDKPGSFGELMERALLRLDAVPVMVEKDWRWNQVLKLAFSSRANTIVATPLVVLGLTKLARQKGTPLYIRRMVTAGYPCIDWMIEGISQRLDCESWGCFSPRGSAIVAGFSCGKSRGVHLREEVYGVRLVDDSGQEVPEGEMGEILLYRRDDPGMQLHLGERARLERRLCLCGCEAPRLLDMTHGNGTDPELAQVGKELMSWTSILDCRLRRTEQGLDVEIVTFPGEKLPVLPNAPRRTVRAWDPDKDEPFFYVPGVDKY